MDRELSSGEKRLIGREFAARQEFAARRRKFARGVFIIGIVAGLGAAALREFHVLNLASMLLGIVWLICIATYVGAGIFPASFARDFDPRWHLNPWREALRNLSEGKTQVEAIALLAGPVCARMLFTFLYLGTR
jgi:hypothetical protein